MLRMIDRHAVHALLQSGQLTREIAQQMGVSQRTIQRIAQEPPIDDADDRKARRRRSVGRPGVPDRVRARMKELIVADPEAPPLEILRQLREEGTDLGESTFYRVFRLEKAVLPTELMVRFEGVAGEFSQFDFGQVDVRLLDGRKTRIHFAAYRLKFSRWSGWRWSPTSGSSPSSALCCSHSSMRAGFPCGSSSIIRRPWCSAETSMADPAGIRLLPR
jgi:hypothetical protein